MNELHPSQMKILTNLMYQSTSRYTEIKPEAGMENNTYQYHLNNLINLGLVKKNNNQYSITKDGKKFALSITSEHSRINEQAQIGVAFGCIQNNKQILIYTRLKQAYYGCQGLPTGKIKKGQSIIEAAKTELFKETELSGEPVLKGVFHYQIYNNNHTELLHDLLLFICRIDNPTNILTTGKEGKFEWVDIDKLDKYITKPFQGKSWFQAEVDTLLSHKSDPIFVEKTFNDINNF